MKSYINKLTMAFLLLAGFTFAACEQDNMGAVYSGDGLSFGNSALTAQEVAADDPTFTVDVYRANTAGTLSGDVTMTATLSSGETLDGCTVSGYSFADGEGMATVTVNVDPLEIGDVLTVVLTLPEDVVSVGGISSVSVSVSKSYTWESLGYGTFTEYFAYGASCDVEIMKAEGFERWRIVEPYTQLMEAASAAGDDWVGTSGPSYIDLWENSDGTIGYNNFYIGYNYSADSNLGIYAYNPTSFGYSAEYNTWANSNTIYLAPIYYIPYDGSWFGDTSTDVSIVITMP